MTLLSTSWQSLNYVFLGAALGLFLIHWAWCSFIAYPMELEKRLKSGKSWIYIPLSWTKRKKATVVFYTRLLLVTVSLGQVAILSRFFAFVHWGVAVAACLVIGWVFWRLERLWVTRRYKQEEDVYFHMHDELRSKLLKEGKFPGDSAFKNLAAYQFQSHLRRADEAGELLITLKMEKKSARAQKSPPHMEEAMEMG